MVQNSHITIIEYKDILRNGINSTTVHTTGKSRWTSNPQKIAEILSEIRVGGGGDELERPLQKL